MAIMTDTSYQGHLTAKQEAYTLLLFQDVPQRAAWVKAGYSSNMSPSTIDENASRLAHNSKVLARLKELRLKAEDASIATVIERKQRLTTIQRATIGDFVDEHGNLNIDSRDKLNTSAVSEIRTEHTASGGMKTTLKLRDPVSAIQEHNKMDGVYQDTGNTYNDNRQINILVASEKDREHLEKMKAGKLPELKIIAVVDD